MTSVAFKRPYDKRNAASTSELPVLRQTPARQTRKRKHPTPPGPAGNIDEDSAPRRKRLAAVVESTPDGGQRSTEPSNRKDPTPSRPPIEEIEMWVPTPNAKFGPPKRKRSTGERLDPPKERPVDIADSAKTSVQTSVPLPSSPQPLNLSKSQIVALREEEEESQSQSTSNQPGGPVEDSTTSDPLQPIVKDAKGATQVSKDNTLGSLEEPIGRPANIQLINPNVNNGHVSGPDSQGVHLQPNATTTSKQGEGVTEAPKGTTPLPAAPQISLVNPNPSAGAVSSLKSPQMEKPAESGPSQIGKPGASSIQRYGLSRSGPPRPGSGTLAERRAYEARVRLDELRRAGVGFGNLPKGHAILSTPHSSKQPPPHVVFKQVVDGLESPSQSQNSHLGSPGKEIAGTSPSEKPRVDPLGKSEKDLVVNKSGQVAAAGPLPRKEVTFAPNVIMVRGNMATSPTALR